MREELWHEIMNEYIKSYESIMHLNRMGFLNDDVYISMIQKLLDDIIITFKSEVVE